MEIKKLEKKVEKKAIDLQLHRQLIQGASQSASVKMGSCGGAPVADTSRYKIGH